ncbi:MAG: CZB domain-containing protein [Gammaproteobacteria bacterium]|nr:CZB domain-containing protein [Gammaproteobacteria bacterium]NNJ91216.1 CZB domain-containing protein [Gammaproteobacteria bacterium]
MRLKVDFDEEIIKHLEWRTMVEALFRDHERSYVSPTIIIQDDQCQLGQWIYSSASGTYEKYPAFQKLIEVHKAFHIQAGTIMTLCNNGNFEGSPELEDEFYRLSGEVVKCLEDLKQLGL